MFGCVISSVYYYTVHIISVLKPDYKSHYPERPLKHWEKQITGPGWRRKPHFPECLTSASPLYIVHPGSSRCCLATRRHSQSSSASAQRRVSVAVSETPVPDTKRASPLPCPAAGERVRPAGGARAPSPRLPVPRSLRPARPGPDLRAPASSSSSVTAATGLDSPVRRFSFHFEKLSKETGKKCRHEGREPLPPPTPAGPERHEPGSLQRPLRSDRRRRRGPRWCRRAPPTPPPPPPTWTRTAAPAAPPPLRAAAKGNSRPAPPRRGLPASLNPRAVRAGSCGGGRRLGGNCPQAGADALVSAGSHPGTRSAFYYGSYLSALFRALYVYPCINARNSSWNRCYSYSHFADEETGSER